jgi:hypothetical protein
VIDKMTDIVIDSLIVVSVKVRASRYDDRYTDRFIERDKYLLVRIVKRGSYVLNITQYVRPCSKPKADLTTEVSKLV